MSAFIVSERTMKDIIYNLFWNHEFKNQTSILDRYGYKTSEDFDRLAIELYKMNREAVKQRYNEADDSDYIKIPEKLNWDGGKIDKFQALKSMRCLIYQCAEGNVPKTKLFKFLEELIESWTWYIINAMPEYEKARWD